MQPNIARLARGRTLWGDALRRMLSNPLMIVGLGLVSVALICAVFAPQISPYGPLEGDLGTLYVKPPSTAHLFGTDDVGRDIFSRTIYGAQITMKIAILAEVLGLAVGT